MPLSSRSPAASLIGAEQGGDGAASGVGPAEELEQRIAEDPFNRRGVATYQVFEVASPTVAPGLESLAR
ncbi:MAG: hypothetical protein ACR2F6_01375 [Mycobacteriales bacterium]